MLALSYTERANRATQNRCLAEVSLLPGYAHKVSKKLLYFRSYYCTGACSCLKENSIKLNEGAHWINKLYLNIYSGTCSDNHLLSTRDGHFRLPIAELNAL